MTDAELKAKLGVGETPIEAQNLASYFDMMEVNKDPHSTAKFEQNIGGTPNSNFG